MKSNLGVSMVELVVVIIIIILIATFAVMNGRGTLEGADATEVYVEMNSVKEALNGITLKQNMDSSFAIRQGEQYDATFVPALGVTYEDNVIGNDTNWYIILGKEEAEYESSKVREHLGLESINHTYIVNFDTGEVELYRPLTILNTKVRTYGEVRNLVTNS